MNCQEAREHIAQGDLPGEHLVACAECRRYADEIALLGRSLSEMRVNAPQMAVPIPAAPRRSPTMLIAAVLILLLGLAVAWQLGWFAEKPFVPEKGTRKEIMKSGSKSGLESSPTPGEKKPK